MHIRGVIFDYGEVLCYRAASNDVRRVADVLEVSEQALRAAYGIDRDAYDRGDIEPSEYWEKTARHAGRTVQPARLDLLRAGDVEMWSKVNRAVVDWARGLSQAGLRIGVLSNMHRDMVDYVRKNLDWIRWFDCLTLSSEVRLTKPDPAIYEHCLRGLSVRPEEALFIDDREINCEGARKAGLHAVRFQGLDQLRSALSQFGLPALPADGDGR